MAAIVQGICYIVIIILCTGFLQYCDRFFQCHLMCCCVPFIFAVPYICTAVILLYFDHVLVVLCVHKHMCQENKIIFQDYVSWPVWWLGGIK